MCVEHVLAAFFPSPLVSVLLLSLILTAIASNPLDLDTINALYPMQRVEDGRYTIGCTPSQREMCADYENFGVQPTHNVILTQSYLVGETEVTQRLYQELMGENPSKFTDCGADCPVESVSWYDAVAFANKLSERAGLSTCYAINGEDVTMPEGLHCGGFRLPTEAEWEVAARGGQDFKYSGANNLDDVGWYFGNTRDRPPHRGGSPHPVRQKKPNGYGLYDMSGNVWEWCGAYASKKREETSISFSDHQVSRGGSWFEYDDFSQVSFRNEGGWSKISSRIYSGPAEGLGSQGFRLVLSVPSSEQ